MTREERERAQGFAFLIAWVLCVAAGVAVSGWRGGVISALAFIVGGLVEERTAAAGKDTQ